MAYISSIKQEEHDGRLWFVIRWYTAPNENFQDFLSAFKTACPRRFRRWRPREKEWWLIADDEREQLIKELFVNGELLIRGH